MAIAYTVFLVDGSVINEDILTVCGVSITKAGIWSLSHCNDGVCCFISIIWNM